MKWMIYALASAFFAGITAVMAKLGVSDIHSNLATFIRTTVVVVLTFAVVLSQGQLSNIQDLSLRTWTFLVLSGIATGLSWLFYFAALKYGPLSGVAPIDKLSFVIAMLFGYLILKEQLTSLSVIGALFIVVGVLLTLPTVQELILHR